MMRRKAFVFSSTFAAAISFVAPVLAAPFYYNPSSFAIYANSLDWQDGASRKFEGLYNCSRSSNTRRDSYRDYDSEPVIEIRRKIADHRESTAKYSSWSASTEAQIREYESQKSELREEMSQIDPTYRTWHWIEFEVVTRNNPKYQHLATRYNGLQSRIEDLEQSVRRYSERSSGLQREIDRLERSIDDAAVQYKTVSLPDSYRCSGGYITTVSPKGKQVCDLSFLAWDGKTALASFNLYPATCVVQKRLIDWFLPIGDPSNGSRSLPLPPDAPLSQPRTKL